MQPKAANGESAAKVQVLEQKLEQQNQKLDSAVKELEQIRAQEAAHQQAEQQRHARVEAQKQAARQMGDIDQQLLTGDTSQVLQQLSAVETSLGPQARMYVEAARQALANSDLAMARQYLTRAAAEAQFGR